jgi:hypoxanthine phosphoribosyltransferase
MANGKEISKDSSMTKKFLEWRDVDDAINRLATNISNSGTKFSFIGGLPRGGLIPAVMLSHKLNTPFVSQANIAGVSGNLLIVDDICDSGKTLKRFKYESNVYTATIHYKTTAITEPNFWWKLASKDEWIVYPWERDDAEAIQDYLK